MIDMTSGGYSSCEEEVSCPTRAKAIIKYTAANSYDTPIAGIFECVVNYNDDLKSVNSRNIYLNGFERMEWTLEALKH